MPLLHDRSWNAGTPVPQELLVVWARGVQHRAGPLSSGRAALVVHAPEELLLPPALNGPARGTSRTGRG